MRWWHSVLRSWPGFFLNLSASPGRVDAVQDAEPLELPVDAVDVRGELRDVSKNDGARTGKIDADFVDHLAGAGAHDQDSIGQAHGFFNAVRDEQYGGATTQPERLEIGAHLQARQRIQRA